MRPGRHLLKSNGNDIVRGSKSKNSALIVLPVDVCLDKAAEGVLGYFENLNSPNPSLVIETTEGSITYMGRYVTSTTMYLPLDIAPRKCKTTCRDVFNTLLVFDGEKKFDVTARHASTSSEDARWLQCFGSSEAADLVGAKHLSQSEAATQEDSLSEANEDIIFVDNSGDESGYEGVSELACPVETRTLPQRSRRANVSYTIDSSSDIKDSSSDASDEDSYVAAPPKKKSVQTPRKNSTPSSASSLKSSGVIDLTDEVSQPSPVAKTPKKTPAKAVAPKSSAKKPASTPSKRATPKKSEASAKKKSKRDSSSSDESFSDDDVPTLSQVSNSSRRNSSRGKVVSYIECSSDDWNNDESD